MQNHRVRLVDDGALPPGTEWVLAEVGDQVIVFTTAAALRPDAMEEMWAAYRLLKSRSHPPHGFAPQPERPLLQAV